MPATLPPPRPSGIIFLGLLLLCSCAARETARPALPAPVTMNAGAGRGGDLLVTLRLATGEELPMILDTGTGGTLLDKSWAPKLGKVLGTADEQGWGVHTKDDIYAAPKFYLGDTPLQTGGYVVTHDFQGMTDGTGHPAAGILGLDVLQHYCLQFDFAAGQIRFLDPAHADKQTWGRAFPIVPLNSKDSRPAIAWNLLGASGPHSLIDSGCSFDGWLMPLYYRQWTNQSLVLPDGEAHAFKGALAGQIYPDVHPHQINVESDGIGIRFLARHLVTVDFPDETLYLARRSIGPLPALDMKSTRLDGLDPLLDAILMEDLAAARSELAKVEQGNADELVKTVARKLVAVLANEPKPAPAEVPAAVPGFPLGDSRAESTAVGWLQPAANRIPLNEQVGSPLLDSGKIYATGLFAHAPSRYVYNLDGKWRTLHGEAGLHTAFQDMASGVVFVIKTDDHEVFRSDPIRGSAHTTYDIDLTGVKTLELIVEKAADSNAGNWALWLDPTLSR